MKKIVIDQNTMQALQKKELKCKYMENDTGNKSGNIINYDKNLLVSVGQGNGGLFVVNPHTNHISKKYNGIFAGLIKYKNGFMALKQPNELYILDEKLKLQSVKKVGDKSISGLHGVKLSDDGLIYIVASPQNKIIVYEEQTMKKQAEFILSTPKKDLHHINDLFITKNSILLSMFSQSGGWKGKMPEQWDGAIVEFDRNEFKPKGIIIDDLTAPHSITMMNDCLYYCDSLNLNVSKFDISSHRKEVVAQFTGFTRGLHFDNNILIIGQSKMRHLQGINHRFSNISIDAGIHLYDCDKQISRFIKLPVGNPYAIVAC
ncbi:DUF4915 domain-containing protein [Priestia megaterium]|uniref:DUF4915 domain-containing protein n=1 Tax=Priestia megaterium TaxID=1404 RepID=UPI003EEBB5A6